MSILSKIIHAIFDKKPMSEEEVARKLDTLEKGGTEHLSWRTSVVDLLKLLDLESSLEARKDLASDLGLLRFTGSAAEFQTRNVAKIIDKTANTIDLLEKNTNSIKDALVKVTGEAEHAKGVLQGKSETESKGT